MTSGAPTNPASRVVDLDHAATTPVRPEVARAMEPFHEQRWGNPSGAHALARDAVRAVDEARERVAAVLGCTPGEVVFTSGGTESDVHAVSGGLPPRPGRPVCSAFEHHAVLDTVLALSGATVAVDRVGRVDTEALAAVLHDGVDGEPVSVVSVMAANNEVGTVVDVGSVVEVVRREAPDVPVHTDAVQAAPWLDVAELAAGADLVSVSAHKLGGPKGVGALVVRAGTPLAPLLHGGGQERGRRSGTTNVAGVVGMAVALERTAVDRPSESERVRRLRDRLADGLTALGGVRETVVEGGDRSHVLVNFCHLLVEGVDSESLLFLLDDAGVRASAASSCSSGAAAPSHVLEALGVVGAGPVGALRCSLGHTTTEADVDRALEVVPQVVSRIRGHRTVPA